MNKKQRRAVAAEKRAQFDQDQRDSGLAAIRKDREHRIAKIAERKRKDRAKIQTAENRAKVAAVAATLDQNKVQR